MLLCGVTEKVMKFDVPCVIHEHPKKSHWKQIYPDNGFQAKLAYLTAKKVYIRNRLAEAQNWRCCWCGCHTVPENGKANSATIEHVIPRSKGGSNDPSNYAMSCNTCNQARRNLDADEFIAYGAARDNSKAVLKAERVKIRRDARDSRISVVLRAIKDGKGNAFDPGSKEWRMYERYSTSPSLDIMLTASA